MRDCFDRSQGKIQVIFASRTECPAVFRSRRFIFRTECVIGEPDESVLSMIRLLPWAGSCGAALSSAVPSDAARALRLNSRRCPKVKRGQLRNNRRLMRRDRLGFDAVGARSASACWAPLASRLGRTGRAGYSIPICQSSWLASTIAPVVASTSTLISLPSLPTMSNS